MRSLIALVPLCVALLSSASPLGDRALFRKHSGAPLARRFILSSRWDVPAACAAPVVPTPDAGNFTVADNSTITPPDLSNVTDSATPDNSTLTAPIAVDNSTVSDNSTISGVPVDANATTSDNSTVSRRYEYDDFQDEWFDLCMNSGGDIFGDSDPCFEFGANGYSALLADADVCAQQENADAMISFAKSLGVVNSAELIKVAVGYRRLARESVQIMGFYPSTPYCHISSINPELRGIWNEQPEGVTIGLWGGPNYPIVPFGDTASCPYGQTPDVTTCSCVSNFFGSSTGFWNVPATTAASSTETMDAAPSDAPITSDSAAPTSSAVASDSASASASATEVASSTSAAPDAAATNNQRRGYLRRH